MYWYQWAADGFAELLKANHLGDPHPDTDLDLGVNILLRSSKQIPIPLCEFMGYVGAHHANSAIACIRDINDIGQMLPRTKEL